MSGPLVFAVAAACAGVLVAAVRQVARRRAWLDVPNERSSHERPTPTAGGIGIAVPLVAAIVLLPRAVPAGVLLVCGAAVAAVAGVGLADDVHGLSPGARLLAHGVAGAAVAGTLGVALAGVGAWPLWVTLAGWTFVAIASINVVNFMDGIDGLIGSVAVVYGLFIAFALAPAADALAGYALAGAATGFLAFNRPPASIFMGDVGSGALGAAFVVLGMLTIAVRDWSIPRAFLPLAPLVVDEVLTMARRVARGENLARAHRGHVYQILARSGWGHARVTLAYAASSAGLAALALLGPRDARAFLVVAATAALGLAAGMVGLRRRVEVGSGDPDPEQRRPGVPSNARAGRGRPSEGRDAGPPGGGRA